LPSRSLTVASRSVAFPGIASFEGAHLLNTKGCAADARYKDKLNFYNSRWNLNANVKLVPLIERPLAPGHHARHFKSVHFNNIPQYIYKLKATTQRVAVALRRASAKGVRALLRHLDHFPVVPSVAAGGAGAGTAAGVGPAV
jgi:hypothetical protein